MIVVRNLWQRTRNRIRPTLRRAWRSWTAPALTEAHILDALHRLRETSPGRLVVHSSLSSCGIIDGGPSTVIRALRRWNREGNTAMPAHSYCYPAPNGVPPVFDVTETPSVVGAVTDAFWRQAGVRRSVHPTHSIACEGDESDRWVAGHESCDTPCGPGTPYERLIEADAAVLMFGVTLDAYTFFHSAEDAAAVPYLYEPEPVRLRFRDRDGREREMWMRRHDMKVARSFRAKDRWLEERQLLRRVSLGRGELLFIPRAREVHRAVVAELQRDPGFLTAGQPAGI